MTCNLFFLFSGLVIFLNFFVIKTSGEAFFLNDEYEKLGFAFDFKIHVDPGKEECFFQEIQSHTNLYVAFQVIKGGDGKAGFGIRDPSNNVVLPYEWKESAEYEVEIVPSQGVYQFCIDNSLSRFAGKLVSLYCSSYKRDEWEKFVDELQSSDGSVSNMTVSLSNVDKNIGKMLKRLDHSKRSKQHDFLLLESNNDYINNFSIMQCCIVIACSIGQVLFLRKMFDNNDNQKSTIYRPRA